MIKVYKEQFVIIMKLLYEVILISYHSVPCCIPSTFESLHLCHVNDLYFF